MPKKNDAIAWNEAATTAATADDHLTTPPRGAASETGVEG